MHASDMSDLTVLPMNGTDLSMHTAKEQASSFVTSSHDHQVHRDASGV